MINLFPICGKPGDGIPEGKLVLITGGVRSGKSRMAVEMALRRGGKTAFIATCVPGDAEMKNRVRNHRKKRPRGWRTLERPEKVGEAIGMIGKGWNTVIVDCLTLLVSNMLLKGCSEPEISAEISSIIRNSKKAAFRTIIVTNEVGMGVVPAFELGRRFRDAAGAANQAVAGGADEVYLMTCGIPVRLK